MREVLNHVQIQSSIENFAGLQSSHYQDNFYVHFIAYKVAVVLFSTASQQFFVSCTFLALDAHTVADVGTEIPAIFCKYIIH